MPLFFITAGYFAKGSRLFPYIKKNFFRLVIPYFFTSVLLIGNSLARCIIKNSFQYSPLQYLISWFCGYGFNYTDKLISFGALWFLTAIFCSNIIFCAMLNCIKDTKLLMVITIAVSIWGIAISKFICLPFNLDIGMYAIIFVCFGYLLRRYDIKFLKVEFIIIAIIAYLAGLYVYSFDLNTRLYDYPLISTIGALGGSFLFLILCQQLEKLELLKCLLSWCGRNSLTILCLHILEHTIIPWNKVSILYNNYFLLVFTKIILIVLGVIVIKKMPGIKNIYGY